MELCMSLSPIADIVADIKAGKMVILVDDEDRENEGDLIIASQFVTPEAINFMATHGRGLICLTLTEARCQQLNLPLMVQDNRALLLPCRLRRLKVSRPVFRRMTVRVRYKRQWLPTPGRRTLFSPVTFFR